MVDCCIYVPNLHIGQESTRYMRLFHVMTDCDVVSTFLINGGKSKRAWQTKHKLADAKFLLGTGRHMIFFPLAQAGIHFITPIAECN